MSTEEMLHQKVAVELRIHQLYQSREQPIERSDSPKLFPRELMINNNEGRHEARRHTVPAQMGAGTTQSPTNKTKFGIRNRKLKSHLQEDGLDEAMFKDLTMSKEAAYSPSFDAFSAPGHPSWLANGGMLEAALSSTAHSTTAPSLDGDNSQGYEQITSMPIWPPTPPLFTDNEDNWELRPPHPLLNMPQERMSETGSAVSQNAWPPSPRDDSSLNIVGDSSERGPEDMLSTPPSFGMPISTLDAHLLERRMSKLVIAKAVKTSSKKNKAKYMSQSDVKDSEEDGKSATHDPSETSQYITFVMRRGSLTAFQVESTVSQDELVSFTSKHQSYSACRSASCPAHLSFRSVVVCNPSTGTPSPRPAATRNSSSENEHSQ
jgi:hypothetical protein